MTPAEEEEAHRERREIGASPAEYLILEEAVISQEAVPTAPTEAGTPKETPAGVPWRALAVGVLILPLLTHFGHLSYIIAQSAVWTAQTLLRGPVVLLFLLVCWTLLWRRASPRLAR